jgi:hypothetical protein
LPPFTAQELPFNVVMPMFRLAAIAATRRLQAAARTPVTDSARDFAALHGMPMEA